MSKWHERISRLFIGHQSSMLRVVRRYVRDTAAAEDIVQDVFSRAVSRGSVGDDQDDTRLLYASARNAALDHLRSETRRGRLLGAILPEQLHSPAVEPDRAVTAGQELRRLEAALAELGPRARDIFLLRRVHELSNAEIAARHGISVSAVEKHVMRAMRHCQRALEAGGAEEAPPKE